MRGKIHSEAVKRAKAKGINDALLTAEFFLKQIGASITRIKAAHTADALGSKNAVMRWHITSEQREALPPRRLAKIASFDSTTNDEQVEQATSMLFGEGAPIDPDAKAVQKWMLDKLSFKGIPMHQLVLEPGMLPRESTRIFHVDQCWSQCCLDGGLSLANHFVKDDDVLRW